LTPAARVARWLSLSLCLLLAACGTYEDKRIRELQQEKGFGSRAQGVATRENYVGGRDQLQFLMSPAMGMIEGWERLVELAQRQPIALDGTIFVPYVGPVDVLGKTEAEVTALVKAQLRAAGFAKDKELDLQCRIVFTEKWFYAVGEVSRKGPVPMGTDMTFLDALFTVGWTPLANLGRVYLIRPDAEHPLVIDVNFREIVTTGLTQSNFNIQERDIIYVPPTFLGLLARLLERLLAPLNLVVQSFLGLAEVQWSYDVIRGEADYYFRY
jgi:protein involved in polysaccharide export with SLBB domain